MTCKTCTHFETSSKAAQRAVLEGFGYCKAAASPQDRAKFFRDSSGCWLSPVRYHARPTGGADE